MRLVLVIAIVIVIECVAMAETLDAKLRRIVGDRDVAVAYKDLEKKDRSLLIREHVVFHAASTMKLPIMMALHAKAGLDLDEKVLVENRFRSIVDGSEFRLDPKDDEDPWTFERLGEKVALRKLIERMIVRSSNLATNLLIERADPAAVTSLCRSLGAQEIQVRRGVEDAKAFAQGLNNVTSANDLSLLLAAIGEERVRGAKEMADVLARQELNEGIPAGLPPGTKVAHKTGAITKIYHDAALVLPEGEKGYVLVVLTRGFEDEKEAAKLVKEISRAVWESR
jgi:beta-lactamase class A